MRNSKIWTWFKWSMVSYFLTALFLTPVDGITPLVIIFAAVTITYCADRRIGKIRESA